MSRRANEGSLFVGRLNKSTRVRDLEDIFEPYGRMTRCEIKYGAEMAYAFIDYEDHRDAEDAVRYENGREICGSSIIVERAKGAPRRSLATRGGGYDDYRSSRGSRDYPDRYDRRGGGARGGRYRSPSPSRRRSRSRSRDRRRRSRSRSNSRRRRRSSSVSPRRSSKRSRSASRSRSRSPHSKSGSRSPPRNGQMNDDKSPSRSPVDD